MDLRKDVSVQGCGRFSAFETQDGLLVRARFVDGARVDYIVGQQFFHLTTTGEGRTECSFAVALACGGLSGASGLEADALGAVLGNTAALRGGSESADPEAPNAATTEAFIRAGGGASPGTSAGLLAEYARACRVFENQLALEMDGTGGNPGTGGAASTHAAGTARRLTGTGTAAKGLGNLASVAEGGPSTSRYVDAKKFGEAAQPDTVTYNELVFKEMTKIKAVQLGAWWRQGLGPASLDDGGRVPPGADAAQYAASGVGPRAAAQGPPSKTEGTADRNMDLLRVMASLDAENALNEEGAGAHKKSEFGESTSVASSIRKGGTSVATPTGRTGLRRKAEGSRASPGAPSGVGLSGPEGRHSAEPSSPKHLSPEIGAASIVNARHAASGSNALLGAVENVTLTRPTFRRGPHSPLGRRSPRGSRARAHEDRAIGSEAASLAFRASDAKAGAGDAGGYGGAAAGDGRRSLSSQSVSAAVPTGVQAYVSTDIADALERNKRMLASLGAVLGKT